MRSPPGSTRSSWPGRSATPGDSGVRSSRVACAPMTTAQSVEATATPAYARVFFWINAVVAWLAVGVSFTLAVTGYYVDTMDPATPTILGNVPGGNDTVLERLLDWSTYFTILSNIVVADRDHHARRATGPVHAPGSHRHGLAHPAPGQRADDHHHRRRLQPAAGHRRQDRMGPDQQHPAPRGRADPHPDRLDHRRAARPDLAPDHRLLPRPAPAVGRLRPGPRRSGRGLPLPVPGRGHQRPRLGPRLHRGDRRHRRAARPRPMGRRRGPALDPPRQRRCPQQTRVAEPTAD